MTEHPIVIASSDVANVTATGITSLSLTIKKSNPTHRLVGIILKFGATITYPSGVPTSVSTAIRDVQIVNESKQNLVNCKGQALAVAALRSFKSLSDLGLGYQMWTDASVGATTVAAYGLFPLITEFKGNVLSITVNINPATTVVSTATAASYSLTATAIELPTRVGERVRYSRILGEYITNQSNYQGTAASRHVTIAADNAELTTLTTTVSVGSRTFSDSAVSSAEDVLGGTIPDGIAVGAIFTGQATKPPTNPQTTHAYGIASFGGPSATIVSLSFTTAPTLAVVTDIEVS